MPKSIESHEKKALFQMLRANTAKFAGKILKLNRLNFRFIGLFDPENSKLAISIHIGSLKWMQSLT